MLRNFSNSVLSNKKYNRTSLVDDFGQIETQSLVNPSFGRINEDHYTANVLSAEYTDVCLRSKFKNKY